MFIIPGCNHCQKRFRAIKSSVCHLHLTYTCRSREYLGCGQHRTDLCGEHWERPMYSRGRLLAEIIIPIVFLIACSLADLFVCICMPYCMLSGVPFCMHLYALDDMCVTQGQYKLGAGCGGAGGSARRLRHSLVSK